MLSWSLIDVILLERFATPTRDTSRRNTVVVIVDRRQNLTVMSPEIVKRVARKAEVRARLDDGCSCAK